MKKVLAFTLGTGLATVAMPSFAFEDHLAYVGGYVTATYTKPSNNGLSIGDIATLNPVPTSYNFNRSLFLEPAFEWEYALGLSYHFPGTCTRFFAEYDYFNDSDTRQVDGAANIWGRLRDDRGYTNVTAHTQQTAHEWRFGFSRLLPFGACFSTTLSAFFEYDKLSQTLNGWFYTSGADSIDIYQEMNSQFHGWGPGIGVGFRGVPFACSRYLGLFASLSTSLFYVDNLFNYHFVNKEQNVFSWDPENSKSIIGKYDIHLGIDYLRTYRVNCCPINTGITLGIRYMNIVNAFKMGNTMGQSYNITVAGESIVNFPVFGVPADWGRLGPYLRFNIGGADA